MANLKITKEVEEKEQPQQGSGSFRSNRAVVFSDLYVLDLNQPPSWSGEEPFGETDQIQEEIALISTRVRVSDDEGVAVGSSDLFALDLNQPPLWSGLVKEEQPLGLESTGLYFLDLNQSPMCSSGEMFGETDKMEEEINLNSSRARVRARVSYDDEGLDANVDEHAGKRRKTTPEDCDNAEESQVVGLLNIAAGEDEMLYCDEGVLRMDCEYSDDDSWTNGVEDCPSPVVSSDDVQDGFSVQLEGFPSPVVSWDDVLDDFYVDLEGFSLPVLSLDEVQDDANFTTGDAEMFELPLDHDGDDTFGIWLQNHILGLDDYEPRQIQLSETHRATANVAPAA